MQLNPKKIRISLETKDLTFLGYTMNGVYLYRPTVEWFERLLYPERYVPNRNVAASRMHAYYLLGGSNDPEFDAYY